MLAAGRFTIPVLSSGGLLDGVDLGDVSQYGLIEDGPGTPEWSSRH